jgi:hypothetical protein
VVPAPVEDTSVVYTEIESCLFVNAAKSAGKSYGDMRNRRNTTRSLIFIADSISAVCIWGKEGMYVPSNCQADFGSNTLNVVE